jgi:hypothetical protein
LFQATELNTSPSHPRKAERVRPTRGRVTSLINPPSARERGAQHQRQKSSHPPASPLVSIVGGVPLKHLPEPPLQAERAWPTRGRVKNLIKPPRRVGGAPGTEDRDSCAAGEGETPMKGVGRGKGGGVVLRAWS